MAPKNSHNIPSWLKTVKPAHIPTYAEKQLRAENIRLNEEIQKLRDSLRITAVWCDDYRKRVKQLETALKEGCGE